VFSVFSESRQWPVIEILVPMFNQSPYLLIKRRNGGDHSDILTVNLVP
jgi:hypothetical protein